MIEVKGNHGKSILFEQLVSMKGSAGIILDDDFYLGRYFNSVFVVTDPNVDDICNFIKTELRDYNSIIIYSNYSRFQIKDYIASFLNIERERNQSFIVMYKENYYAL